MMDLYEANRHRASWTAAFLGCLTLDTHILSCATSEGEVNAQANDVDGGFASGVDAKAQDAACVGDSKACAKRQDACSDFEWCPVITNHPIGIGLSSVWGSGANDVWVVGAAGSVIHWDGSEWKSVPVATTLSLYAIWGTGPNDVWTVSLPNKIFHTTGFADGTAQWSLVNPIWDVPRKASTATTLNAIWGTSPSDIWVGAINSAVSESGWRTVVADGGFAWKPMSSFANRQIRSLWGSGPDDIWLVGSKGNVSFAAHTNGVAAATGGVPVWTEVDTQSMSALHAVWGSGPGDVWTVGDYGTIRHFAAGDAQWGVVNSPTTESLRSVWGTGPDDIWAVGKHGTFVHYDGTAWRASSGAFPPGRKPDLFGVWGSGRSDVWAVGSGIVMHYSGPKPGAKGGAP